MSNFALRPINIEIRKKLLQKQRAFARYSTDSVSTDASKATSPVNDGEMLMFFNRTTWAHLISLSVIKYSDDISRLAIIGGGELGQEPGAIGFTGKPMTLDSSLLHELDSSVPASTEVWGIGDIPANEPLMKTSFKDIYRPFKDGKSTLLKPISGIKSISTRYEGTLKSRRQATVQFTIFSLEDLDRLSPHFFRVGGDVLLEFGWNSKVKGSSYDFSNTLGSKIINRYHDAGLVGVGGMDDIDLLGKKNTAENYEKAILDLKGDYEYVLGSVSNFDYSLRGDGGFDCTIVLSTVGMSLLDNKVNREESPSQILQHQLYVQNEKATDKPHTNFYQVIENLPEIMTYSIIDNYINTTGKGRKLKEVKKEWIKGEKVWHPAEKEDITWPGTDPLTRRGQAHPSNKSNTSTMNISGYTVSNTAFSDWHRATSTSQAVAGFGLLSETIKLFAKVAEILGLPKWMHFKDTNTGEVYYHNYYTNETAIEEYGTQNGKPRHGTYFTDDTGQRYENEAINYSDPWEGAPLTAKYQPVTVDKKMHIERILGLLDGSDPSEVTFGEPTIGIADFMNQSFDAALPYVIGPEADASTKFGSTGLDNYVDFMKTMYKDKYKIDLIPFLKNTPADKRIIMKTALTAAVSEYRSLPEYDKESDLTPDQIDQMLYGDHGWPGPLLKLPPIDFGKTVRTYGDMTSGKLDDPEAGNLYSNTGYYDDQGWQTSEEMKESRLHEDFTMDFLTEGYRDVEGWTRKNQGIDISPDAIDPKDQYQYWHHYNPAIDGNSEIFMDIHNSGMNMVDNVNSDTPDEESGKWIEEGGYWKTIPSSESEYVQTYSSRVISLSKNKAGRKIKTIFIGYIQGDAVQAFTGFNWDGGTSEDYGDFDTLAKEFCKQMFPRTEKQKPFGGKFKGVTDASYQPIDPETGTQLFGTLEGSANNEFLEGFLDGHLPKTWIRWGWFEDNIISKYLGFESVDSKPTEENTDPAGRPVSIFKSVEPNVDKETDDIIPGYESNKMILPTELKTTDVTQIIIPDRCRTLDRLSFVEPGALRDDSEPYFKAKLYGTLGMILSNGNLGIGKIYPVATKDRGEIDTGYIRNLFVEVDVLREAFLNIGSLREGIDNFFHVMRRNFGPIHDFEIQPGRDEGMVGIVDNNLLYSLGIYEKPTLSSNININQLSNDMKVYEFPAWEKESIVKSQDLKVTIPDSMAITALYAGNEYEANIHNYDKSVGSLKVQKLAKFLKLDETGNDPRKRSYGNKSNMRPLFESKNLVSSGNGINEKGMIRYLHKGDFFTSLSSVSKNILTARGIDVPIPSLNRAGKVVSDKSGRKPLDFWEDGAPLGWYNPTGMLGDPIFIKAAAEGINYRVQMEYELEYDVFSQVEGNFNALNGLMSLGLTIDGTAGIFPGNSYISKYLPLAFEKRTAGKGKDEYPLLFQATNVEHEISPSGWNTTINGMARMNNKAFSLVKEQVEAAASASAIDTFDGVKPDKEITDGLSRFLNFFNLNADFAIQSTINIIGINPVIGIDDDDNLFSSDRPGSFSNIMGVPLYEKPLIERAIWEKASPTSRTQSLKNIDPGYADYTSLYNALANKSSRTSTIPEKLPEGEWYKKASRGIDGKILGPPEAVYNPLEMLLFSQISSVIVGITYNTMRFTWGQGADQRQREIAPPTVARVFYTQALADIMDWPSDRPEDLRNVTKARLIDEFLIDKKNIGKQDTNTGLYYSELETTERQLVAKYFGITGTKDTSAAANYASAAGTLRSEIRTWSEEMWGQNGPGGGNTFTIEDLASGLLDMFVGGKRVQTISRWYSDHYGLKEKMSVFAKPIIPNDVNDQYILIGPIHAGIPDEGSYPAGNSPEGKLMSTQVGEQYAEFTIAFWNLLFAAILKNELGIPVAMSGSYSYSYSSPNWEALDTKLKDLYKKSRDYSGLAADAILDITESEIMAVDSQKIFEHALQCQYLINNPSKE